jgi:hypothetical protein
MYLSSPHFGQKLVKLQGKSPMPRKYEMSWQGAPYYRWRRMYQGVRYVVTCEELNAPLFTEEGSYRLANRWWREKMAELTKPTPEEEIKTRYQKEDLREKIAEGEAARGMLAALEGRSVDRVMVFPSTIPFSEQKPEDRLGYLVEAENKLQRTPIQRDKTLGHQAGRSFSTNSHEGRKPTPTPT